MPDCFPSAFSEKLRSLNRCLANFAKWQFQVGMLFGDRQKWWGDGGQRPTPHEGLDLLRFVDKSGRIFDLPVDLLLPPVLSGEVAASFADFLGQTIVLKHDIANSDGWYLHSAFGHIAPLRKYFAGDILEEGEPFAVLGAGKGPKKIPAHLHMSIFWLKTTLPPKNLDWSIIGSSNEIVLEDPIKIL